MKVGILIHSKTGNTLSVSGATYSSMVIVKAVENALK